MNTKKLLGLALAAMMLCPGMQADDVSPWVIGSAWKNLGFLGLTVFGCIGVRSAWKWNQHVKKRVEGITPQVEELECEKSQYVTNLCELKKLEEELKGLKQDQSNWTDEDKRIYSHYSEAQKNGWEFDRTKVEKRYNDVLSVVADGNKELMEDRLKKNENNLEFNEKELLSRENKLKNLKRDLSCNKAFSALSVAGGLLGLGVVGYGFKKLMQAKCEI